MRIKFLFAMTLFLLIASNAVAATIPADALIDFQVDAYANVGNGPYATHVAAWKDTGLLLNAGDEFALVAVGIAAESPAGMAAGGRTPDSDGWPCGSSCLADLSRYALVGKIGTDLGDEFFVGSAFSGIANDTGTLYLAFNDSYYLDNLGFFTVSTTAVPEPSTALLFGIGLAGLAVTGRRRNEENAYHARRNHRLA